MTVTAMVCSGAMCTRYIRAGRGPAVILLARDADDASSRRLVEALQEKFLVIAPFCLSDSSFDAWLTGVLDGLGIQRVSIVAEQQYEAVAASFAAEHPSRIEQVVNANHLGDLEDVF